MNIKTIILMILAIQLLGCKATQKTSSLDSNGNCDSGRVYAGGIPGLVDILKPEGSRKFRAAGGGLYLHNNGWATLNPAQKRKALKVFAGQPIMTEIGFGRNSNDLL